MSVSVRNVVKLYGDQKALEEVSFEVQKGEVVGLLGPNGAGKTTTMKILSGFIDDFEGEAMVKSLDVRMQQIEVKKCIGYLPEHNPLYLDMYVKEYLSFIGSIYGLRNLRSRVSEMIEVTGLSREQHKIIRALSKGYRQRVGLAQALIHDPDILILDEPTTGLDPNQLVEIRQLIKTLGASKTVIFSSHIMQEVQAICDRVIILHQGKLVADNSIEYLEKAFNKEREIVITLDTVLKEKWDIRGLSKSKKIGESTYQLVFEDGKRDPRILVFDFVVGKGYKILEMTEKHSTMEDVFQKITQS